jgi:hypothetical protein
LVAAFTFDPEPFAGCTIKAMRIKATSSGILGDARICSYFRLGAHHAVKAAVGKFRGFLLSTRFSRPVTQQQQGDARCKRDTAINRPASLSGHETAWKHIDPLQEPNDAC